MKAKTHVSKAKLYSGFTLVEILVVIAMIASLAALSIPAYKGFVNKAKKQKVQVIIAGMEQAVDNFETEYNYLPYEQAAYPADDSVYNWINSGGISRFLGILMGLESTKNFKQIKFLELPEAKGNGPGGTTASGPHGYYDGVVINGAIATLYSPSGMSYAVRIDHNLNGEVANPHIGWPTSTPMQTGHRAIFYTVEGTTWDKAYFITNADITP